MIQLFFYPKKHFSWILLLSSILLLIFFTANRSNTIKTGTEPINKTTFSTLDKRQASLNFQRIILTEADSSTNTNLFPKEILDEISQDDLQIEISMVYYLNGYKEKAIDMMKSELWRSPCDSGIQHQLGSMYCDSNQIDHFRNISGFIMGKCSNDPGTYVTLANVFRDCNNNRESEAVLEKGIQSNPEDYLLRFSLGEIYFENGKLSEAEDQFVKALEHNPNDPAGYFSLGEFLYKIGQKEEAKVYFEKAIQISSDYKEMVKDFIEGWS